MEDKNRKVSVGAGASSSPAVRDDKLRISVAMATYNGEKFIEEQLLSICNQTRRPDEIVISDDGSKDSTLEVVSRVAASDAAKGIDFVVITDNPRHGCGGNFEWALTHTTGDVAFVCGQDDIWLPDKVSCVLQVFMENTDALCVLHNAEIIDGTGEHTQLRFLYEYSMPFFTDRCPTGEYIKLGDDALEQAVSAPLIAGIAVVIHRALIEKIRAIPTYAEDQWIEFLAVLYDGCYFVNRMLAYYRKHEQNTSGTRSRGFDRIKRFYDGIRALKHFGLRYTYQYELGCGFVDRLDKMGMQNHPAYGTATRILDIGKKKIDAYNKGSILGAWSLTRLYRTDMRYRRCGFWAFFYELLYVLRQRQ